jgi:hypothetical protein
MKSKQEAYENLENMLGEIHTEIIPKQENHRNPS